MLHVTITWLLETLPSSLEQIHLDTSPHVKIFYAFGCAADTESPPFPGTLLNHCRHKQKISLMPWHCMLCIASIAHAHIAALMLKPQYLTHCAEAPPPQWPLVDVSLLQCDSTFHFILGNLSMQGRGPQEHRDTGFQRLFFNFRSPFHD